jgi:glycosyltransferase involved in cell wall biosynthesis
MTPESARRSLHWLCWQPTPYNDYLFQHLARDPTLDLTVHFRSGVLASHPWQTALAQGYKSRIYQLTLGVDWHLIHGALRDRGAFFLVAGWDHTTSQVLLTLLRLLGRRYALWTDAPDVTRQRRGLRALIRGAWLRWVFAGAARVLGTGEPAVRALSRMGAPASRLTSFPYWIDIAAYARDAAPLSVGVARPLRFISSGRINNRLKGHDVAVAALALAAANGAADFEYCIAGAGSDEEALRATVRSVGLESKVRFLGWVEPEELRGLFRSSDALIHPSPVHEPYGVAVIEAMAAGLVVFASDVTCAATDRITHGENGFIHHAGDVSGLAQQLTAFLRNPASAAEIGRRARITAEQWPIERAVAIARSVIQGVEKCAAS